MKDSSEDDTKAMGKVMMALAWAVILGLLMMFFYHWEQNAYNPNTQPESSTTDTLNRVILERNKYHHYITQGKINDDNVIFLLDTGASDVVIPEALAATLKLKKGARHYANTANGTIDIYRTQIQQLSIGNITLYNVNASINPHMNGMEVLLGMSALKNIEFTQRGNQLTLKQYHE